MDTDKSELDKSTWSPTIQELIAAKTVEINPYNLELDYTYWSYCKAAFLLRLFFFNTSCSMDRYH